MMRPKKSDQKEPCPVCTQRQKFHDAQTIGRNSAIEGKRRDQNPFEKGTPEASFWEYGWIENSFMEEIEEHRAVLEWIGQQLFLFNDEMKKFVSEYPIDTAEHVVRCQERIFETIATKIAERLGRS